MEQRNIVNGQRGAPASTAGVAAGAVAVLLALCVPLASLAVRGVYADYAVALPVTTTAILRVPAAVFIATGLAWAALVATAHLALPRRPAVAVLTTAAGLGLLAGAALLVFLLTPMVQLSQSLAA